MIRSVLQRALRRTSSIFRALLRGRPRPRAGEVGRPRSSIFYDRFREILSLNDGVLALIADLEDGLAGKPLPPFDHIAERLRGANLDVRRMVEDLEEISGRRLVSLAAALERINGEIEAALPRIREVIPGPLALPLRSEPAANAGLVGPKMANLAEVWRDIVGPEVPDGFVVTAAAFARFLTANDLWKLVDRLDAAEPGEDPAALRAACEELERATLAAEVPPEVEEGIRRAAAAVGGDRRPRFAVRSSSVDEDRAASAAGQYLTVLDVEPEEIPGAWRRVVASAFRPHAVTYRRGQGLPAWTSVMAVGCIEMVVPRLSGVLFTRDDSDPDADRVVISWTPGRADEVLAGRRSARDVVVVDLAPPALRDSELAPEAAVALARLGRLLESHFGSPRDVEWAIDGEGTCFVLQARPLVAGPRRDEGETPIGAGHSPLLGGGSTACPGAACGKVFRVATDDDLERFPAGSVLVAAHSSPRFSRVMDRAEAILTDVGSPTGHMAILTREYGVPCIVGLEGATGTLATGRTVTVDATRRLVFDGALPAAASSPRRPRQRASDAPAVEALRRVVRLVAPLRLTDPSSPEFRPERCETLHDVTRYVHESLFEAVFRMGELARGDGTGVVRLGASLPFAVLLHDLGGGLAAAPAGPGGAPPEAVACSPMRAFLAGLLDPRIRWNEPRPVSAKGFLSVVGESLTGPPPETRTLGRVSYAVISDRYMNFTTKAGYHFSAVDAFASGSLNQNYIHFRFAGGGAGVSRRDRRVRFLRKILAALGFCTQDRGDVLIGRMEKESEEVILGRLERLGRLTMVTRQLDMLMDTDASPEFFADAFLGDRMEVF